MKIQISPIPAQCMLVTAGNAASQSKRREENCAERYSKRFRDQNDEHLVNIYESNILETQVN